MVAEILMLDAWAPLRPRDCCHGRGYTGARDASRWASVADAERGSGMMQSVTLGRVREIEIKVHPTFALVIVWVLFVWRDPVGVSGGGIVGVLFGLLFVVLVFGCVLLHELGHSFMAMNYGIRVRDVTLSAIGGVARIEHFPSRPATEIFIALAGPAMNVAIVVALAPVLIVYGLLAGLAFPGDYLARAFTVSPGGLLLGLVYANVLMVAFNLLPLFPMDGGRILRAGLSTIVGRETGTKSAVLTGQALAVALAVASLIWLHSYSVPLIAAFIIVVAQAEGKAVRLESAMRRLRVGQFALWDMGGIAPDVPLMHALRGGPRDIAVTRGGQVVGMLWRNQLLGELHNGLSGRTVGDVMDENFLTADIQDSVYDVQQRMNRLSRWAVPITENGVYRGIFTADRFVHVYHQLAPGFGRRRYNVGFTNIVHSLLRLFVR